MLVVVFLVMVVVDVVVVVVVVVVINIIANDVIVIVIVVVVVFVCCYYLYFLYSCLFLFRISLSKSKFAAGTKAKVHKYQTNLMLYQSTSIKLFLYVKIF